MNVLHKASEVKRITRVVNVLFQHGLGYFVEQMELKFHLPFIKKMMRHRFRAPPRPEAMLVSALEELGGTYVKLGQLLSIRPDLTSLHFSMECQKLQDRVKPFPFKDAKKIVEDELKKPLHELFENFHPTPIASASIGQVYDATLKTGERVAVKVQRPNIREEMESDINIIAYFARRMERLDHFKKHRPAQIVEELRKYTEGEIDYLNEARNAERFHNNFKGHKSVKIPKVYRAYTTQKVLTLEYIAGKKLTDLIGQNFNKELVLREGLAAEYKQIFEDGFFHADLHPGNIMLQGNTIAFLDFGIVGNIDRELQRKSVSLFLAIMGNDAAGTSGTLISIGKPSQDTDTRAFQNQVESVLYEWHGRTLNQERVTTMLHRLFKLCSVHNIQLPIDFVLLGKALVTIEATCRMIDPDFDVLKNSEHYFTRIAKQHAMLQARAITDYFQRLAGAVLKAPEAATELINKIRDPHVRVDIDDKDIRKIGLEIDRSSNRLAYGILIAAFVVAGAMMIGIDIGPKALDVPVFSLACFSIAAGLGAILIYSVLAEGK